MLKRLFTSNARIKILTLFLGNQDKEFYIRELTRKLDEQINSIRRELDNLKKLGLLESSTRNRKKYYRINPQFLFLRELTSIFNKAIGSSDELIKKIKKLGTVDFLVLSGIFINKEASIDLLIVGELPKESLALLLESEVESKEPVKFSLLDKEDFLYRYKCNDRFIMDLIQNEENIIAVNRFGNQI